MSTTPSNFSDQTTSDISSEKLDNSGKENDNGQKKGIFKGFFADFTLSKVNKLFYVALGILLFLLLLSIIILAARLFSFSKTDDRAVSLKADSIANLDVFSLNYENDSGIVTVDGAEGEKVLAPGTKIEYTVRIRNTDKVAIDFALQPSAEYLSDVELPLEIRLISPDELYLLGSAKSWAKMSELNSLTDSRTLLPGESCEYVFQWRWEFERGDDEYDTWLGSNALKKDLGVDIDFSLHAEVNTSAKLNGGLFGEHTKQIVFILIILILLLIAIVLLILSRIHRKAEPVIVYQPAPVIVPMPEPEPEPIVIIEAPKPEPVIIPAKKRIPGKRDIVNLDVLSAHFESGALITLEVLKAKGLVPKSAKQVKVLNRDGYKLDKALMFNVHDVSAAARKTINEAGGQITLIFGS